MVSLFRLAGLLVLASCAAGARASTYYVDAIHGSDNNSGTTGTMAWQTLQRVNSAQLTPGDRVLFRRGEVWHGQFAPSASGKPGLPLLFDCYGTGALPLISGDGTVEDAVLLRNVEEIELHHLAVTNLGLQVANRRGVDVLLDNYGTAHHIVLADLYVHDVNGADSNAEAPKDTGGIFFRTHGSKVPSRFDNLLIERNIVWKVDRSGIVGESSNIARDHWFPSLHVVLKDNYVVDIGGDGIVPWATEGAIVEGNVAQRCNQRSAGYNAGIWQWSTHNTLFYMNESFETKGTRDGEGFDSDFNSTNTHFTRNYSHDNDGGFMLICTPVKRNPAVNIGNTGTVLRENISRNDNNLLINLSGADDVLIIHNLFFVGRQRDVQFIASSWGGWSKKARFTGNTFFVEGSVTFGHSLKRLEDGSYSIAPGWEPAQDIHFVGNHYFGKIINPPVDDVGKRNPPPPTTDGKWPSEPTFDPADPDSYADYLRAHGQWLAQLFKMEFPHGA
jgi:hypothetical protein